MQRRSILKLGVAGTAVLALLGGGAALLVKPGWQDGRLSPDAVAMFRALGVAVLDALLPAPGAAREAALAAWLTRLQATLAGLPAAAQSQLNQLLTLLSTAPGRLALMGLASGWPQASTADVQAALQALRVSELEVKQQAFHALRDLSNAAWFADASSWPAIGYPGPTAL